MATPGSRIGVGMSCLLFRNLESEINARADTHEGQQRGVEFRHRQLLIYANDKDKAQRYCPEQHLEPVKGNAVDVR